MSSISFTGVCKTYVKYGRPVRAIDSFSYSFPRGSFVLVHGRGGSGKSTFLKLISGILNPTSGVVSVPGNTASLADHHSCFEKKLTARENVRFFGSIQGVSRAAMDREMESIGRFAGLFHLLDHPLHMFTDSELSQLAISVLVHVSADTYVIDRIPPGVSSSFLWMLLRRLQELHEGGGTIFIQVDRLEWFLAMATHLVLFDIGDVVVVRDPLRTNHRLLTFLDERKLLTRKEGVPGTRAFFSSHIFDKTQCDHFSLSFPDIPPNAPVELLWFHLIFGECFGQIGTSKKDGGITFHVTDPCIPVSGKYSYHVVHRDSKEVFARGAQYFPATSPEILVLRSRDEILPEYVLFAKEGVSEERISTFLASSFSYCVFSPTLFDLSEYAQGFRLDYFSIITRLSDGELAAFVTAHERMDRWQVPDKRTSVFSLADKHGRERLSFGSHEGITIRTDVFPAYLVLEGPILAAPTHVFLESSETALSLTRVPLLRSGELAVTIHTPGGRSFRERIYLNHTSSLSALGFFEKKTKRFRRLVFREESDDVRRTSMPFVLSSSLYAELSTLAERATEADLRKSVISGLFRSSGDVLE